MNDEFGQEAMSRNQVFVIPEQKTKHPPPLSSRRNCFPAGQIVASWRTALKND
jgi:hypothetical protein